MGPRAQKTGILGEDSEVRDLFAYVPNIDAPVLGPAVLERIALLDRGVLPIAGTHLRLGAPVAGTRHFIAVGLNYSDHAA